MTAPWIEIKEYQDLDFPAGRSELDSAWQALFACQVLIPSHAEWIRFKWGMNAYFLLEESLERQRLFLESQYAYPDELGREAKDLRTLALRFTNRPGEGLLVAVLGKIHAPTEAEAQESGFSYYNELQATFPHDYRLVPACTPSEFGWMAGEDILESRDQQFQAAEIKRMEFCPDPNRASLFLQGFWRSAPHAHEQIWRSLAASHVSLLWNITLRSTVIYKEEREGLLKISEEKHRSEEQTSTQFQGSPFTQWKKDIFGHQLAPWKKLFYLQMHLASSHKLNENLFRTIGTSLTFNSKGEPLPGYQVVKPGQNETGIWQRRLKNLDIIFSDSFLQHPRLSEVADLNEVFEVMQLPYSPPDQGVPDVKFVPAMKKMDPDEV